MKKRSIIKSLQMSLVKISRRASRHAGINRYHFDRAAKEEDKLWTLQRQLQEH